jgi:hypothetical protein
MHTYDTSWFTEQGKKKTAWSPLKGHKQVVLPEVEPQIRKILALRQLEGQIADWVKEELKTNNLPEEVLTLLYSNIADEVKHEKALDNIVDCQGYEFTEKELKGVEKIKKIWKDVNCPEILKAACMERALFMSFLLFLRENGTVSMRNSSLDITGDEYVHTSVHAKICEVKGYKVTEELEIAVIKTMYWVMKGLNIPGKRGNPDEWVKNSVALLESGFCKAYDDTGTFSMIAPFECSNASIPSYA